MSAADAAGTEALAAIVTRQEERAIAEDATSAFVRVHLDWTRARTRLRSNYVVLYRYREGSIVRQELYYDPSGALETLAVQA